MRINCIISLQSKGLTTLFEEIVTNPAEWDTSGLLRLRRKIDPNGPQHACKIGCSPNMCKGMVRHISNFFSINFSFTAGEELDAFLERHQPDFDRVIYVG